MNKVALAVLIAFIGISTTAGFSYFRDRQSLNIQLDTKGLQDDGLTLIGPLDPAFDAEVASLVRDNPTELMRFIESAKPLCVFIKNTGTNSIAGFRVKWELLQADGKIITRWSSASNPEILSGDEQSSGMMVDGALPIRPGTSRLVSWEPDVAEGLYAKKRGGAARTDKADPREEGAERQRTLQQKTGAVISVTVSADGAYFEDGSFVGADTGNLFAETQGYIEATLELTALTRQHIQRRGKSTELFGKIESIANDPHEEFGSGRTAADYKILFKRIQAQNLMRVRDRSGDGEAMRHVQRNLEKNWTRLRKKSERT